MRRKWIQDPVTHKLIEIPTDHKPPARKTPFLKFEQEPFRSPVDGSIISNARQLRAHNREHNVIDSRDWGNKEMCNTDAKRDREQIQAGTHVATNKQRKADVVEAFNRVEAGHKPIKEEI
jgi:hypothetical protein